MAKVLFISETALKDTSYINENVDMKVLQPIILLAQDKYIHTAIGTGLYNELKTQITASTTSALNQTLLNDYIQPALTWWVVYELPMPLTYKFTNKSVLKKNSESGSNPDIGETFSLMERAKNNAEWYSERLSRYLRANVTSYPLYANAGSTIDTIYPEKSKYSTGMYLGDNGCTFKNYAEKYQGQNGLCNE